MDEICREANAVANLIEAAGSKLKNKKQSSGSGSAVKQQLFKKEAILSLLSSSSQAKSNKKKSSTKMNTSGENKENGDIQDFIKMKLDFHSIEPGSNGSSGMISGGTMVEMSGEGELIPGLAPPPVQPKQVLVDKAGEQTSASMAQSVKHFPLVTEVKCKRKRKQKSKATLIDISDDFDDMDVSSPECVCTYSAEENPVTEQEMEVSAPEVVPQVSVIEPNDTVTVDDKQKKHSRLSTYTLNTLPYDALPENKRRSLPVVAHMNGTASVEKEQKFTRGVASRRSNVSRLRPPSKLAASVTTETNEPVSTWLLFQ